MITRSITGKYINSCSKQYRSKLITKAIGSIRFNYAFFKFRGDKYQQTNKHNITKINISKFEFDLETVDED